MKTQRQELTLSEQAEKDSEQCEKGQKFKELGIGMGEQIVWYHYD